MQKKFGQIMEQGNDWSAWETLCGTRLASGMKLEIRWANGSKTAETIKVATSNVTVSKPDPNTHVAKVKTVEYAFVEKCHRGVKTWVHLKGLMARLIK